MGNLSKYSKLILIKSILAILLVVSLVILSACSGTYGRVVVNTDVKDLFERSEVIPNYRYFYIESETWPRVVIGIHENFTLESEFWRPIDLTPERLERWLDFDPHQNKQFRTNNGSDILDDNGNKIGIWYSLRDSHDSGAIRMLDSNRVEIALLRRPTTKMLFPSRAFSVQ